MLSLCVCPDDISLDLNEQIRACRECGIAIVELRSVQGVNVLDFVQPVRAEIKARFDSAGIRIACIGSNVGRVPITEPWSRHFDRFKTAIDAAAYFGAPLVRICGYAAARRGDDVRRHRDEVLRRTRAKVEHVSGGEITLVLANEQNCYGEQARDSADLIGMVHSRALRCAFDPGGFVICGQHATDAWRILKPLCAHLYASDARFGDRQRCPAGEGDGKIAEIAADAVTAGYAGHLCLDARRAIGFGSVEIFKATVNTLRQRCAQVNVPLATT